MYLVFVCVWMNGYYICEIITMFVSDFFFVWKIILDSDLALYYSTKKILILGSNTHKPLATTNYYYYHHYPMENVFYIQNNFGWIESNIKSLNTGSSSSSYK